MEAATSRQGTARPADTGAADRTPVRDREATVPTRPTQVVPTRLVALAESAPAAPAAPTAAGTRRGPVFLATKLDGEDGEYTQADLALDERLHKQLQGDSITFLGTGPVQANRMAHYMATVDRHVGAQFPAGGDDRNDVARALNYLKGALVAPSFDNDALRTLLLPFCNPRSLELPITTSAAMLAAFIATRRDAGRDDGAQVIEQLRGQKPFLAAACQGIVDQGWGQIPRLERFPPLPASWGTVKKTAQPAAI